MRLVVGAVFLFGTVYALSEGVSTTELANAGLKDQTRLASDNGHTPPSNQQDIIKTDVRTSRWEIDVSRSKIDDSERVIISSLADDPVQDKFGNRHIVTVVAACREQKTDFYIVFGGMFMADIQDFGEVTLRLDQEKARRIRMTESTDNRALGLWNGTGIRLLKSMYGKNRMLVVATPYNESNVETTVSLDGFDEALARLRTACKW